MRRPQAVGRVTGTDSHAFFIYVPKYYNSVQRGIFGQKRNGYMKAKTLFSFVGGAVIGAAATIVIVSRTNNILSDAEYKDYLMITNKDNLIFAYKAFFVDFKHFYNNNQDLMQYVIGNMDEETSNRFLTDMELINSMEQANNSGTPSEYTIETTSQSKQQD